jgi:hypothetical protein
VRAACLVLLAGCNSLLGVHDFAASTIDAPALTADAAPPSCLSHWLDGTVRFAAPEAVAIADTTSTTTTDRDPVIGIEEKSLIWSSDRGGGGFDEWESTRTSVGDPWGPPMRIAALSSTLDDTKITFSLDNLVAVVARDTPGVMFSSDLYEATRTDTTQAFGAFTTTNVAALDDSGDQYDPVLTDDGLGLVYSTNAATLPQNIAFASRNNLGTPFVYQGLVVPMVSGQGNADPDLSGDQRLLVFSSTRPALTSDNLWYATRATAADQFGAPIEVPDVNLAGARTGDAALSRDGCTLYFGSDRVGSRFQIYAARVITK